MSTKDYKHSKYYTGDHFFVTRHSFSRTQIVYLQCLVWWYIRSGNKRGSFSFWLPIWLFRNSKHFLPCHLLYVMLVLRWDEFIRKISNSIKLDSRGVSNSWICKERRIYISSTRPSYHDLYRKHICVTIHLQKVFLCYNSFWLLPKSNQCVKESCALATLKPPF